MKNLLDIARAFLGVYRQFKRFNDLLEWNLMHGFTVEGRDGEWFKVYGSLPATKKEIKEALTDKDEYKQQPDEEVVAGEAAIEIMRRRAKGEKIDPDEPGADFDIY